jgi:sugar lactone lactonase YvrE
MNTTIQRWALAANLVLVAAAGLYAADSVREILLPQRELYPESITSLRDGTLIVGSVGKGNVWKIAPGNTGAYEWIKAGTNGLSTVLGVLADEKSNTLWVCSSKLDDKGGPTSVKTFNLQTGEPTGSYALPGDNAFCNDIAVASNGTAYVADTRLNSVLMLKKGAKQLEVAAKDDKLAGADGLAFGDNNTLYVNSVSSGKLFRLPLGKDGKATKVEEMTLSRPLDRPDGMRSLDSKRLLLAENAGKMDIVTVQGLNANVTTLKEGLESTPAVTATRGMAWIIEGKLNYRNDAKLKGKEAAPFKMVAVPLPK